MNNRCQVFFLFGNRRRKVSNHVIQKLQSSRGSFGAKESNIDCESSAFLAEDTEKGCQRGCVGSPCLQKKNSDKRHSNSIIFPLSICHPHKNLAIHSLWFGIYRREGNFLRRLARLMVTIMARPTMDAIIPPTMIPFPSVNIPAYALVS